MGRIIKWSLVALVVCLILSDLNIKTSIYHAKDNSIEIKFPQWQAEKPWFYLYWTPGTFTLTPPPVEEDPL